MGRPSAWLTHSSNQALSRTPTTLLSPYPGLYGPLPSRGCSADRAVILVMAVNAVYAALLAGNILLIIDSLFLGPCLLRACRAGVVVNGVALMLMFVPLLNLLGPILHVCLCGFKRILCPICVLDGFLDMFTIAQTLTSPNGSKGLKWSERQDLNLRRLGPKPSALPG
jgi:hypothetical protein